MINPMLLSNISYTEAIKEDLLSFLEIDLIPIDRNDNTFLLTDKDINNTRIETKRESEEYRFNIEHCIEFKNCTINNLVIAIKNYSPYVIFNNCEIEVLTIEIAADQLLERIYLSNTNAKTIIIKEIEPVAYSESDFFNTKRSYIRNIIINNPDSRSGSCTVIHNLTVEGYSSVLKNRVSIRSGLTTDSVIENLTISDCIVDYRSLNESIHANPRVQPQLIINKLNLNNVSIDKVRNLNFKNISINIQELNTWKRLEKIKSDTYETNKLSTSHPRFDIATLFLLSQVLATFRNTGLVVENEVSKLKIPGLYPNNVDLISSIQISPQTKVSGVEVYNEILNNLNRDIPNSISRTLSFNLNYVAYKSTVTLEDLDLINSLINNLFRSKLNFKFTEDPISITLDINFKIVITKSEEFTNYKNEDDIDFASILRSSNMFSDTSNSIRRREIQEEAETVVALDRNRGRTRSRPIMNPTFRLSHPMRQMLDTPTVTPTNFDPGFLQNRTTAVSTPPDTSIDTDPTTFSAVAISAAVEELTRLSSQEINSITLDSLSMVASEPYPQWDVSNFTPSGGMFIPRDPISSLQVNLEATPQYDIDIFSESDED